MAPSDTGPKAGEVYFRRLAEMSPAERINAGILLWDAGHEPKRSPLCDLLSIARRP
jgi:hypothetical protein